MTRSHLFGRACEDAAARHLEGAGWTILERNYRFGRREIDLIAERGGITAFVEVKGRRSAAYGHPLEAITWAKRREIIAVARHWIARHGRAGMAFRFDAIAVIPGRGGAAELVHVEGAWEAV